MVQVVSVAVAIAVHCGRWVQRERSMVPHLTKAHQNSGARSMSRRLDMTRSTVVPMETPQRFLCGWEADLLTCSNSRSWEPGQIFGMLSTIETWYLIELIP